MDNTEHLDVRIGDHGRLERFSAWVRPAKELRQIDRIVSQRTDSEIARMHGAEAGGIVRLREIREALGRTPRIKHIRPKTSV